MLKFKIIKKIIYYIKDKHENSRAQHVTHTHTFLQSTSLFPSYHYFDLIFKSAPIRVFTFTSPASSFPFDFPFFASITGYSSLFSPMDIDAVRKRERTETAFNGNGSFKKLKPGSLSFINARFQLLFFFFLFFFLGIFNVFTVISFTLFLGCVSLARCQCCSYVKSHYCCFFFSSWFC